MRRPSKRQLSSSILALAGLGLATARAEAQVPQPPAANSQASSFVVDSSELGSVLAPPSPGTPTVPGTTGTTGTGVKPRRAKKTTSAATTTIQLRLLEAIPAPSPAAPTAPSTRTTDGGTIPASVWAALRKCESGGNYAINSGNGYYGAYQFAAGTWRKLGYSGLPHEASPDIQDEAARKLQGQQGWAPWPACTRKLGLR